MITAPTSRVRDHLPILALMLIWGSMGIPSTYAVREFSPLAVLCLRSGIAAVILFPYVRLRCGTVKPPREEWGLLFLLSVIGVVLCNYLYFFAVQHTSLTNDAILYALGPIMTTVLAVLFLHEKAHFTRIIGIIIAFAGVVALLSNGDLSMLLSIRFNSGDIAQLLSSLCLAVYTILSKRIQRTPPVCVVLWMMLLSFLITLPMVLIGEGGFTPHASPQALLSVLYLGVLCSSLGYLLQQLSIQRIGASASAAFLNGISPITILTAGLILQEPITSTQILCMAIVFLGVFLNARNRPLLGKRHT